MSQSRVNVKAIVTGPPARYTRAVKASTKTTISNSPAQNTRSARETSFEHLMRMM